MLQAATLAYNDEVIFPESTGLHDQIVTAALFHDCFGQFQFIDHASTIACVLEPWLDFDISQVLLMHERYMEAEWSPHNQDAWKWRSLVSGQSWFPLLQRFCHYDAMAFQPDWEPEKPIFFEEIVTRTISKERQHDVCSNTVSVDVEGDTEKELSDGRWAYPAGLGNEVRQRDELPDHRYD